jgi:hypothetical protein
MTRLTLRRALRRIYAVLFLLLAVSLGAKVSDHIAILNTLGVTAVLKDLYEFLRDMALLIATGGAAYIANLFQKRASFIDSLKTEWHDIVEAKSALLAFSYREAPSHQEYMAAFTRLSETLDNMRVVYRNVGETGSKIGLYPFTPLHDMRRVLQTLDPRDPASASVDRKLARDTMLHSFYALRDGFLEELDLEEPEAPLLNRGARRLKTSGSTAVAKRLQAAQTAFQARARPQEDESDVLLRELYDQEASKNPTAWPGGRTGNGNGMGQETPRDAGR